MRIIAGQRRGLKLLSPPTDDSRPILDRVKESLFSVLYGYGMPAEKVVGDVFSGVGSMGLEALSRGAKFATFVEKDPKTAATLEKNIQRAGFSEKSRIIKANAIKVGSPPVLEQGLYDLVFIDPPYPMTRDVSMSSPLAKMLEVVQEQITPDGLVIVRTHEKTQLLDEYHRLHVIDARTWGNMTIFFLRLKTND